MVTRVNGSPKEGVWFSADVRFLTVTATGLTADTDVANEVVNSGLEQLIEAVETRGTVIALTVTNATTVELMVDYAQAFDDAAVVTEVEGLIDAVATPNLSGASITVGTGFAAA